MIVNTPCLSGADYVRPAGSTSEGSKEDGKARQRKTRPTKYVDKD